jgi:hypothetical protein
MKVQPVQKFMQGKLTAMRALDNIGGLHAEQLKIRGAHIIYSPG